MSDNWIVQNLENALETWNDKLSEIWALITMTPQSFRGGKIWDVIVDINGAVQSIGLALLVLFFVAGVVKTCGSFTDVKKPEHAMKLFVRFALAKGAITYGMELRHQTVHIFLKIGTDILPMLPIPLIMLIRRIPDMHSDSAALQRFLRK